MDNACKEYNINWDYTKYLFGFSLIFDRFNKNNQLESNIELSIKARKLLEYIKQNNNVLHSIKEVMNYLNVKDRNARMIINELINGGYIVRKGSNKNGFWELI